MAELTLEERLTRFLGRWLERPALLARALPLLAGTVALAVLVRTFDAPPVLVATCAAAGLVALIFRPGLAVVLVTFAIYANLGRVAHQMHGVPRLMAGSFLLLLLFPVAHYLLLRRETVRSDGVFRTMLLLLGVMLVSSLRAQDKAIAAERMATFAMEGLLVYWLVVNAVRTASDLRRVILAVVATGTILAGMSLYQAASGAHDQDFGGLAQRSTRVQLVAEGPEEAAVPVVTFSYRAGGPFSEPNRYGQILIVLLPLAVVLARHSRSAGGRWCAGTAAAVILGGIVLTYSRGTLVSLVPLLLAFVGLHWIRPRQLMAGAACLVLLSPLLAPRLVDRIATLGTAPDLVFNQDEVRADGAIRGRATQMLAAASATADRPLLGLGPGQYFPVHSPDYHQSLLTSFRDLPIPRRAHNLYLEMSADLGLVGLAVFLAIPGLLILRLLGARAARREREPFAADLVMAFVLSIGAYLATGMFLHLAFERYLWFLLALAGATLHVLGSGGSLQGGREAAAGARARALPSRRRTRCAQAG